MDVDKNFREGIKCIFVAGSKDISRRKSDINLLSHINASEMKVLAQKRDIDGPMQDRALDVVKQFIVEKGLILFGGLSIDLALRLKGSHIYPEGERPDYDFLSPQSVEDSYDLADKLHKSGFENVGCVRAIHVQTMRVKVDYVFVADVGYAPASVFNSIPTLNYSGMKIVHPDFQRMDMHLAFCYPFANAPREDVFHRWKKDLERFNLLDRIYPIKYDSKVSFNSGELNFKLPLIHDKIALHGFAAYAVLRKMVKDDKNIKAPTLPITINKDNNLISITFSPPTTHQDLVVISPWPKELIMLFASEYDAKVTKYNPWMDVKPSTYNINSKLSNNLKIYSTAYKLHAIVDGKDVDSMISIVTPHALLLYFLFEAHQAANKDIFPTMMQFYYGVIEILNHLGYEKNIRITLPTSKLGDLNMDPSYLIRMAKSVEDVGEEAPPPKTNLPKNIKTMLSNLPINYNVGKRRPNYSKKTLDIKSPSGDSHTVTEMPAYVPYNYDSNPLFVRDGKISSSLTYT
jgi:hypothetical protein